MEAGPGLPPLTHGLPDSLGEAPAPSTCHPPSLGEERQGPEGELWYPEP